MSHILIVDDNWMNREILEAHLETGGYQVESVHSGAKALEAVGQRRPSLVILDLHMPGIDGFEVCARLKGDDNTRTIPVLVLSTLDNEAENRRAVDVGADDFLTKPINALILLTRVRTLVRLDRLQQELVACKALLRERGGQH